MLARRHTVNVNLEALVHLEAPLRCIGGEAVAPVVFAALCQQVVGTGNKQTSVCNLHSNNTFRQLGFERLYRPQQCVLSSTHGVQRHLSLRQIHQRGSSVVRDCTAEFFFQINSLRQGLVRSSKLVASEVEKTEIVVNGCKGLAPEHGMRFEKDNALSAFRDSHSLGQPDVGLLETLFVHELQRKEVAAADKVISGKSKLVLQLRHHD
jgi:hypothetical protein